MPRLMVRHSAINRISQLTFLAFGTTYVTRVQQQLPGADINGAIIKMPSDSSSRLPLPYAAVSR
jgi:hypothetical protein